MRQRFDMATTAAQSAHDKPNGLEGGGIGKAAETVQLINNLLQIAERAAAAAMRSGDARPCTLDQLFELAVAEIAEDDTRGRERVIWQLGRDLEVAVGLVEGLRRLEQARGVLVAVDQRLDLGRRAL